MATESTNKQPEPGPAPGQRPQTTAEPGRTTVAQKQPEKVKENPGFKPEASGNPVTNAPNQSALDKAVVDTHTSKDAPSPAAPKQLTRAELNDEMDRIVEDLTARIETLAAGGSSDDIKSQIVARIRRGVKGVGAAPLRHTSGGSTQEDFDEARKAGLAPVQGSF